jgi:hypothetical protein
MVPCAWCTGPAAPVTYKDKATGLRCFLCALCAKLNYTRGFFPSQTPLPFSVLHAEYVAFIDAARDR